MPRIYATSDLHGQLPEIPDCDALLIVGDICPDFGARGPEKLTSYGLETSGEQQADWLMTTFREWLNDLTERDILVLSIWGNHDFVGEHKPLVDSLFLPWTLLQDETKVIKFKDGQELSIHGTPWVPNLPNWAFYASPMMLKARADAIPRNLDILMAHGPPYGYGDMVGPKFGGPVRVGDEALAYHAETSRLASTILCGHIHEDGGSYRINDHTLVRNVSYVDENYKPNQEPVLLDEFL
jgi:Icc-related predicted phosphoesterase